MKRFRSHSSSTRLHIIPCVLGALICLANDLRADVPNEPAVRQAVAKRLKSIQSIIATYDTEETNWPENSSGGQFFTFDDLPTPPPPASSSGMHMTFRAKTGTDRASERFCFVEGNARWESVPLKETATTSPNRDAVPRQSRT